jgi:hypothetical protein
MSSKALKNFKTHRQKRRKTEVRPDYFIKIVEYHRSYERMSPGRLVIAAEVIINK